MEELGILDSWQSVFYNKKIIISFAFIILFVIILLRWAIFGSNYY
ncbi:hypothetical protein NEIELOOT_02751 [Neisseria elongata subsp. glycolytica ATCC 29315]|uniref:Uncharacterized protein n=1 Tax=Neisseria elongata subsp. glycolytica ATCC 29315 TaxID=546263 RepID=D4DUR8_NEIEG|nr:hypothetical protein NEIELOOT_02751 [Neisseria elongata subsp. glycolytica ATCC 29315]